MSEWLRSVVVVVLVPVLGCVGMGKYAGIPDSRLTKAAAACFDACDEDDVACVARCPGAESGDGFCYAKNTVTDEGWRVRKDGSRQWATDVSYKPNGACVDENPNQTVLVVVGGIAATVGSLALVVLAGLSKAQW